MLDNYGTHKHPVVNDWLSHHPRFQLHFTPTSASWMNQVETVFFIVHRKAISVRGVFRSVAHLKELHPSAFLDAWNANCHPFAGRRPRIRATPARAKPKAISGPVH